MDEYISIMLNVTEEKQKQEKKIILYNLFKPIDSQFGW